MTGCNLLKLQAVDGSELWRSLLALVGYYGTLVKQQDDITPECSMGRVAVVWHAEILDKTDLINVQNSDYRTDEATT